MFIKNNSRAILNVFLYIFLKLSFIIPIYNNKDISKTINSIRIQNINEYEILIIRNGYFNDSYSLCCINDDIQIFEIRTKLKGKALALNLGIKYAKYDKVCILDADTILGDNCFVNLKEKINDKDIIVIGSRIDVLNNTKSLIETFQKYEYKKTFNIVRKLINCLNADFLISGAFGIFNRNCLININGFDTSSVGEDMEIILRLQEKYHKDKIKIYYSNNIACYTKVKSTFIGLLKQRDRWQRGLLDSLIKHKKMIFNSKYNLLGLLILPYLIIFELLGPIILVINILLFLYILIKNPFNILKVFNKTNYILVIVFIVVEITLTIYADAVDYKFNIKYLKRIPKLILITLFSVLIQIPLSFTRTYGIITYHWRKTKW